MIRLLLLLAFLASTSSNVHSQNCLNLNFVDYSTAPFNPNTCRYTIGGVSMRLYNLYDPQPMCQAQGPDDHPFFAVFKRTDLPLYQGPGILKIHQKVVGCGVPLFYIAYFSDGTTMGYNEVAEIDESIVTIDSILIGEIECGLAYLFNNALEWGVELSIQKFAEAPVLLEPLNEVTEKDTALFLTWAPVPNSSGYYLQVDTTDLFIEPIYKASINSTQKWVSGLEKNRTYYWRVGLPNGSCQDTIWSETWEFTTKIEVILYNHQVEVPSDHFVDSLKLSNLDFTYLVVADGTYTLSLKRNRGKFTIRNGSSEENYGILMDTMVEPNVWITRYTAPRSFQGNKILLDYKHDELHPTDFTLEFITKPVPVIFLHGLSSNGLMWGAARSSLIQHGWNEILLSSPSYPNDQSFYNSANLVPSYVQTKLDLLRNDGIFVNQVSLVGHSMGGLVSRKYLANYSDTKNINRLISINTPHSGSEIGNFVLSGSLDSIGLILANWVFGGKSNNISGTFNVNAGAINSLRVNSNEILNLISAPSADVPVHAIASDFTLCDNFNVTSGSRLLLALSRMSGILGAFAHFSVASACTWFESLIGTQNDGVVRLSSQFGGLDNPPLSNLLSGSSLGYSHLGITDNSSVTQSLLPNLLSKDPQSIDFSSSGFDPEILPPPFAPLTVDQRGGEVSIEISGINDHDTLHANNSYFLTVQGSEDVHGIMVLYYFFSTIDSVVVDTAYSQSHTFLLPNYNGFEGKMNVIVMGTDGMGNVDVDTLALYISQTTSTKEKSSINTDLSIFQNILKNTLIVKTQGQSIGHLLIVDVNGRVCIEENIETTFKEIDISSFRSGVYFASVRDGNRIYSKKIVVNMH